MTKLGRSHILRGYYEDRYRDLKMTTLQSEYRAPVFSIVGFAVFAGIGYVAHNLNDFKSSEIKYSYGLVMRHKLTKNEKVNIRIDFRISDAGNGLYLTMKEAF